jgi:predicted ABC-type ATPase
MLPTTIKQYIIAEYASRKYQRVWTDSPNPELPYFKVYNHIIAEFDESKINRDSRGRFSTTDSRGAKKPRNRDTKPKFMGNDPNAPSKIAKAYKLTNKPNKAQIKRIVENSLDNNPEYIKRFNNDLNLIAEQIQAGKETHKLYGIKFDKKGNVKKFDKLRAKMHNKILREEYKKINAIPNRVPPLLTVIMGRPGSGKSSFEKRGENSKPWAVWDAKTSYGADPDFFKAKIGLYDKKYSNPITAGLTHEESSFIYKRAVQFALNKQKSLVMDQTLASDKTRAIQTFKDQGYEINLVGVSTSVGSSISSATERYIIPIRDQGSQIPGRLVPPKISASNTSNEANFEKVIPIADSWKYYTSKLGTTEFDFVEIAGSPAV